MRASRGSEWNHGVAGAAPHVHRRAPGPLARKSAITRNEQGTPPSIQAWVLVPIHGRDKALGSRRDDRSLPVRAIPLPFLLWTTRKETSRPSRSEGAEIAARPGARKQGTLFLSTRADPGGTSVAFCGTPRRTIFQCRHRCTTGPGLFTGVGDRNKAMGSSSGWHWTHRAVRSRNVHRGGES